MSRISFCQTNDCTVQFLSDRLKCSNVLEEVTEVGSPFQMVGAVWLKARQFVSGMSSHW